MTSSTVGAWHSPIPFFSAIVAELRGPHLQYRFNRTEPPKLFCAFHSFVELLDRGLYRHSVRIFSHGLFRLFMGFL
jgi:hypothetical protein